MIDGKPPRTLLSAGKWEGVERVQACGTGHLVTMEMLMLPDLGLNNPFRLFLDLPKEVKFSLMS